MSIHENELAAQLPPHVQTQIPATSVQLSGTVLLVDDDAAVRDILCHYLRKLGVSLVEAETAAEALERFDTYPGRIDVLITDVSLQGMNGIELARVLRARNPLLKVVLMSGFLGEEAMREHNAVLLPKPFSREVLYVTLLNLLEPTEVASSSAPVSNHTRPSPPSTVRI